LYKNFCPAQNIFSSKEKHSNEGGGQWQKQLKIVKLVVVKNQVQQRLNNR